MLACSFWRAGVLLAVSSVLAGCFVVDHQSGRAVRYNIEAENAQQQALLLNIVRASLRRPMQFTTVTNLDGDQSAKANMSWAVPFGSYATTSNVLTVNAPDYTEQASIKVATLDDSSYYKGLLSPVPPQLFDLFVHSGYPVDVLVNLFVRKIVIQRIDPPCGRFSHIKGCEFTFSNAPSIDIDIDLFQRLVSYLLRLGLTTEQIERTDAKPRKKDDDDDSASENDYVLCFAPGDARDQALAQASLCGSALNLGPGAASLGSRKQARIGRTSTVTVRLEPRLIDGLGKIAGRDSELARELAQFSGQRVALKVYTRSIQNIIYFLGELARKQFDPEFERGARKIQVLAVPRHPPPADWKGLRDAFECKVEPPRYPCRYLFQVRKDLAPGAPSMSTWYEGEHYHIVDDRGTGVSTQVFDIAKQLFAIKIKADKLPRTTTISVIR